MSSYLWDVYITYIDEVAIYGLLFVTFISHSKCLPRNNHKDLYSEFKVHLSIHYLLIPYFEDLKFLDVSFPNRCQFLVIGLNQDNPYTLSIHL